MRSSVQKWNDFYSFKPNSGLLQTEFGFYCLQEWKEQGHIDDNTNIDKLFGIDHAGHHMLGQLGWCEAGFNPEFETKVLEDRGEYELVQDFAGRSVLCFKGRRSGFMPEYVDHPVKDRTTWEALKWRLDPTTPARYTDLHERMVDAKQKSSEGYIICAGLVGGYMYLRSLMGPEGALYMFYDDPDLVHDCMKTWFALADYVTAKHQEHVSLNEVFIAEDICYNVTSLISPDCIREFLFPYYQQLLDNCKKRNLDKSKKIFFQVDTDGNCLPDRKSVV